LQKHHCRAFWSTDDGSWNEAMFAAWRDLGGMREIESTAYLSQAGVFSAAHIDPGSEFLASHLPTHLSGHVADLGAGWGYLSDVALTRCPKITRIDLFEADARALQCARNNLARHENETGFHWHDVTTGLPETYDSILMNPPFHSGQATDVDLGRNFLTVAAGSLKRGGALYLVANRQLPYESLLDQLRLSWRIAAENPTYKLIFAIKR
jgi:16S rRNA (guanine1207-N2)-methyltransferase